MKRYLILFLIIFCCAPILFFEIYRFSFFHISTENLFASKHEKLLLQPEIAILQNFSSNHTGEKMLMFKPSSGLYLFGNKMVSFLDPEIIDFYNSNNVENAFNLLKNKEIHFIFVPPYYNPSFTNSPAFDLVNNQDYTRLITSYRGYQIYELLTQPKTESQRHLQNSSSKTEMIVDRTENFRFSFLTRKNHPSFYLKNEIFNKFFKSRLKNATHLFIKDIDTKEVASALVILSQFENYKKACLVTIDLSFFKNSSFISYQISEFLIGSNFRQSHLKQFRIPPGSYNVSLVITDNCQKIIKQNFLYDAKVYLLND
jgi:hypothetical protein